MHGVPCEGTSTGFQLGYRASLPPVTPPQPTWVRSAPRPRALHVFNGDSGRKATPGLLSFSGTFLYFYRDFSNLSVQTSLVRDQTHFSLILPLLDFYSDIILENLVTYNSGVNFRSCKRSWCHLLHRLSIKISP